MMGSRRLALHLSLLSSLSSVAACSHDPGAEELQPPLPAAEEVASKEQRLTSTESMKLVQGVAHGVGNDGWVNVSLPQAYTQMVVVASPMYAIATSPPLVTRITNAGGSSFDLRVDRFDAQTGSVSPIDVQYIVVEAGSYSAAVDGIKMEAVVYDSTVTGGKGSWNGETRTYLNTYSSPIVVGQVMSYNDPDPSVFWSRGSSRSSAPSSSQLRTGKHVGEDPDKTRATEQIGYVVVEAGSGTLGGFAWEAGLGPDQVGGSGNAPYVYGLLSAGPTVTGVVSQAGMDGTDGSWAIINSLDGSGFTLQADEDQMNGSERNHTKEQVAFLAFDECPSGSLGQACNGGVCNAAGECAECVSAGDCDDADECTLDSCDAVLGCQHVVDEGGECSAGLCDAAGTCVECLDDGDCDDGDACNGAETCDGSGTCQAGSAPNCDDGNECTADSCDAVLGCQNATTQGATCSGGYCDGAASCVQCLDASHCDDGNVCNGAETCDGTGTCQAGTAPNCDDGNECTADSCDAVLGCQNAATQGASCSGGYCDGAASCVPCLNDGHCDDGNACNGAETCDGSGTCQAGTAPNCDDGNECTADSCDAVLGCQNVTTQGATCSGGYCDAAGTCVECLEDADCEDGNECTATSCVEGACEVDPKLGDSCSGGSGACDGAGACASLASCSPGASGPGIHEGDVTIDSTDTAEDLAALAGKWCVSGSLVVNGTTLTDLTGLSQIAAVGSELNLAGNDAIVDLTGLEGVRRVSRLALFYNDMLASLAALSNLTSLSYLQVYGHPSLTDLDGLQGVGSMFWMEIVANPGLTSLIGLDGITGLSSYASIRSNDGLLSLSGLEQLASVGNLLRVQSNDLLADLTGLDSLASVGGALEFTYNQSLVSLGGAPLLTSVGSLVAVDNATLNVCALAEFEAQVGSTCSVCSGNLVCDDGDACNGGEGCSAGVCQPGTAPNCDDGSECTADSCDAVLGCQNTTTQGSTCSGGYCDGAASCVQCLDATHCDDGDACNGAEACDGSGTCQAGTAPNCDDGSECTADSCDAVLGCQNTTTQGSTCSGGYCDGAASCVQCLDATHCDDGNVCNGSESCDGSGSCQAGTTLDCDDGNECTSDACDPVGGCSSTDRTAGETCSGGVCDGMAVCAECLSDVDCPDGSGVGMCDDTGTCQVLDCNPGASGPGIVTQSVYAAGPDPQAQLAILDGATCVIGNVLISGTNLTDLSVLSSLRAVTGDLSIGKYYSGSNGNASMTSLTGLENLRSVGGELAVNDTPVTDLLPLSRVDSAGAVLVFGTSVGDLQGLEALTSVGGNVLLYENPLLTTLTGLENLTTVGGHFDSWGNPALISVTALGNLTTVGDRFLLLGSQLTTLAGLENLTAVGSSFSVSDDDTLEEISALSSLTSVQSLGLWSLPNLTSLAGLTGVVSVQEVGLGALPITSLSGLEGLVAVDYLSLSELYDLVDVTALSGVSAVDSLNLGGLPSLTDFSGLDTIAMQYLSWSGTSAVTSLPVLDWSQLVSLDVIDSNLVDVDGLSGGASLLSDLRVSYSPSFASLSGALGVTNLYVLEIQNTALTDMNGLQSLSSVEWMSVSGNPSLATLDGLEGLTSVFGLTIHSNDVLASLDALSALTTVGSMNVGYNPSLPQCQVDALAQRVSTTCDYCTGNDDSCLEYCNESGECVECLDASHCDDGNECTTDSCDAVLGCENVVARGAACSGGYCNAAASCVQCLEASHCDDGNACNGSETCDGTGTCQAGSAPSCDDGNECTSDSCDTVLGCQNQATQGASCSGGYCDASASCVECLDASNCDDGNACNGAETCDGTGTCQAGIAPSCDDGNECTVDSCDPGVGCQNATTQGATCTGGYCDVAASCVQCLNASHCDDGNACNGAEACDGTGTCQGGAAPNCDDGLECTTDSCDPATGCANVSSVGDPCSGGVCSESGACVECLEDADCPDGTGIGMCDETGTCQVLDCNPGASGPGILAQDVVVTGANAEDQLAVLDGVTCIVGDVLISGTDLTDLTSLGSVRAITGSLFIGAYHSATGSSGNPALTTLTGLENLRSVGAILGVYSCDVTDLLPLSRVDSVGALVIESTAIGDLRGLEGVTDVPGQVRLMSNDSLVSVDGLENLAYVGGNLVASYNPALESVTGLSSLTTVVGNLEIDSTGLPTLTGLESLAAVGRLMLTWNDSLGDISALSGLVDVVDVVLAGLPLTDLTGLSSIGALDSLELGTMPLASLHGLEGLTTVSYLWLGNLPNLVDTTSLSGLSAVVEMTFLDLGALTDFSGLDVPTMTRLRWQGTSNFTTSLPALNYSALEQLDVQSSNLVDLAGLAGGAPVLDRVEIWSSFNLESMHGMEGITTLSSLQVYASGLLNTDGLEALTSVGELRFHVNVNLTSLEGLSGLQTVGMLNFFSNLSLPQCEAEELATRLGVTCWCLDNDDTATCQ